MDHLKLRNLFKAYREGTLAEKQQASLEDWYIAEGNKAEEIGNEIDYTETELRIWEKLSTQHRTEEKLKIRRLWSKISIAAAVATIIVSAGIWFLKNPGEEVTQTTALIQDIPPGKIGATLTLANGKKITLSEAVNGQIAKEAGISISKTADGQLVYSISSSRTEGSDPSSNGTDRSSVPSVELTNTLSTAKGETYQLRLPDGSLVYLNAASSLEYPVNFTALKERRVKLTGEGYFEIAKDKAHPFIVKTDKQEVEVLGTHFNVNAYKDEGGDKTTLLEGSVKVSLLAVPAAEELAPARSGRPRNDVVLKPGQQANVADDITVNQVKIENVMAWKNGYFMFNDESLENIMLKVSRWYDVEVLYLDPEIRRVKFYGTVSKFEHVSKVLRKLELTGEVKFKIEGKQIKAFKIKKSLSN